MWSDESETIVTNNGIHSETPLGNATLMPDNTGTDRGDGRPSPSLPPDPTGWTVSYGTCRLYPPAAFT